MAAQEPVRARERLTALTCFTWTLFRESQGHTPRRRFEAMIRRHQATNGCSNCAHDPSTSISHYIADKLAVRGLVPAVGAAAWYSLAFVLVGHHKTVSTR